MFTTQLKKIENQQSAPKETSYEQNVMTIVAKCQRILRICSTYKTE